MCVVAVVGKVAFDTGSRGLMQRGNEGKGMGRLGVVVKGVRWKWVKGRGT